VKKEKQDIMVFNQFFQKLGTLCYIRQDHLAANATCEKKLNEYKVNRKFHIANNLAVPFVSNAISATNTVPAIPKFTNNVLVDTFKFQSNRKDILDDQT
jgi:hypothetical protein